MSSSSSTSPVFDLKAKYPTITNFSAVYNPTYQLASLNKGSRFVYNESPSIKTIGGAYGEAGAKAWMKAQMVPVLGLSNVEGDSLMLIEELINVLYERFFYERCSVFILFCAKCRAREYKISYGSIKIDAMLDAANTFLKVDLPVIKAKAGAEIQKPTETKLRERNVWKYITWRQIWIGWLEGLKKLMAEKGESALVRSCEIDDEHHDAVCGMLGIGALTIVNGHAVLKDEVVEEYIQQLPVREYTNN